jgi:hypothetical protein
MLVPPPACLGIGPRELPPFGRAPPTARHLTCLRLHAEQSRNLGRINRWVHNQQTQVKVTFIAIGLHMAS